MYHPSDALFIHALLLGLLRRQRPECLSRAVGGRGDGIDPVWVDCTADRRFRGTMLPQHHLALGYPRSTCHKDIFMIAHGAGAASHIPTPLTPLQQQTSRTGAGKKDYC
jgi:hypothetical protein